MSVAIVTGASRGLGQALAEGLAREGWSLVIDGRDARALEAAAARLEPLLAAGSAYRALAGDITDPAHRRDLTAAAAELGGLDLLINNAGTLGASPLPSLGDYPLDELRVAFEVNVVAPLGLIQATLPLLLESPRPVLLNITSDAAVWAVDPGDLRTAMHQAAFPGEDISDRPDPVTVVPAFLALIESDRPSGRYRASELVGAEVSA